MRTSIWLFVLAVLVLVGGGALAARPFARSVVQSQAAARGIEIDVGRLNVGWFSARLENSKLRLEGVDSVSVLLDDVRVDFGLTSPRLRHIEVRGGRVEIQGELDKVQRELSDFRKRRRPAGQETTAVPARAPSSVQRTEIVRDLEVVWENAFGEGKRQYIGGLIAERGPEGQRLGADLISLSQGPLQLELAGFALRAEAGNLDLEHITEARVAEARISYRSELDSVSTGDAEAKESATKDSHDGEPKKEEQERGLKGALRTDPERVAHVKGALTLIKTELLPRLPAEIAVERLWMSYQKGSEKLSVGPNHLVARQDDSGLMASLRPQEETKGTPLALILRIPRSSDDALVQVELEGGPVALSTLGIQEGDFGMMGVSRTTLQGKFEATVDPAATHVTSKGQLTVEGLRMDSPKLSPGIVAFPKLFVSGKANLAVDGSFYEISGAELSLGEARIHGDFAVRRGGDFVTLRANLNAPLVSCQALLESAPRGLLGLVEDIDFAGTFSLRAGVEADTRQLSKMKVRWDFENGCTAKAVPRSLDPDQFRGAFRREVIGSGMLPMEVEFGPQSMNWTPLENVSEYVEMAILVSEDGRFYRHDGFDDRAIESAIAQNTRAGRFVRGASTISMQLAKNLYLSREKTLARKLQEAALTSLLEQSFDKKELIELYMNIVEFGPGVYGIRQAASHYFDTTPSALTPAQAFFLISILPAPNVDYFEEDGSLNEKRLSYVRHLLRVAHQRKRLSEQELEESVAEEPRFGQADTRPRDAQGRLIQEEETIDEDLPQKASPPDPFGIPSPAALRPRTPEKNEPAAPRSAPRKEGESQKKEQPARRDMRPVDPRRRGIHL